jgi:hypothetical protein
VSSANTPAGSANRGPLVIILTVIGILAIIAGILYVSGAANSVHFMDGAVHHGHHVVRAVVSFVVGIAFLIGAYIARSRPTTTSRGSASGSTTGSASGSTTGSASGSPSDSTSASGT